MLPADIYLAGLLGLTKEQYQWFKAEIDAKSGVRPGEVTAGLETIATISAIFSLISIGLAVTASFFKPREKKDGGVQNSQVSGGSIARNQKFSSRSGFQSVQSPAALGETIPLIYSDRAYYPATLGRPAGLYGGIRVQVDLLWSQMLALGGDEYLKSLFMIGEGRIGDIEDLAIGDSTVNFYWQNNSSATQRGSKFTAYFNGVGGRIKAGDYKFGRAPYFDPGNSETLFGAPDVYHVYSAGSQQRPDFCYTYTPSANTSFGLSDWLPNGMFHRINPTMTATGSIERKSYDNGERFKVVWTDDFSSVATLWKQKYQWSYRCGVTSPSKDYAVNDEFEYVVYADSDDDTVIFVDGSNAEGSIGADGPPAELSCNDIASTVAGYQSGIADSMIEGEIYKFGSALAVLTEISPTDKTFVSTSGLTEGRGQTMRYKFRVVRAGYIQSGGDQVNPNWSGEQVRPKKWDYAGGSGLADLEALDPPTKWKTVSDRAQGFKYTSANIRITRPCKVFEIRLRSTVGLAVNGFFNFRGSYDYSRVNDMAGGKYIGNTYDSSQKIQTQSYTAGTVSAPEQRYSFFRMHIRVSPSSDYIEIPASFAVRSNTGQAIYNYIRFELAIGGEVQLEFEPISSWEIRSGRAQTPFIVIDYRRSGTNSIHFSVGAGLTVYWTGTTMSNKQSNFRVNSIEPKGGSSKGLGFSDDYDSMTDAYAAVAEAFCYSAIETTIRNGPEHEVVGVNVITENSVAPDYRDIATLGFNARSARSWSQLSQVSVGVPKGKYARKLLKANAEEPTNLFPDVFRDILLSERFGMGDIFTEDQIEVESFVRSAQWNLSRRYFFDGVLAEKVNLRQWAADVSATMLLEFYERDGRFALEPAVRFPEEGPVPISGLFTAGNIIEGSFSLEVLSEEERQPVQVSIKWREQRSKDSLSSPGVFPVEREIFIREASGSESDTIESINIAEYCTNRYHAIDCACYIIRVRNLITHTISFSTIPEGVVSGLKAGDFIKVALDYDFYNDFTNGIVLKDGTIITTKPETLPPGTHQVAHWNGSVGPVIDGVLTIGADGKAQPSGVIFALKSQRLSVRVYRIASIKLGEESQIEIGAIHHPTDENGLSLIGKNWTTYQTDSNWIIRES